MMGYWRAFGVSLRVLVDCKVYVGRIGGGLNEMMMCGGEILGKVVC